MAALTSFIRLSTEHSFWIGTFFVSVAEVEPFVSHVDALVDTLEDSNHEKKYFRALVSLARATSLLYVREEVPTGFALGIRERLKNSLHAYTYVLLTLRAQGTRGDI